MHTTAVRSDDTYIIMPNATTLRTLYLSFKTAAGGDALLDQTPFESTREMLATAAVQLYGNRLSVHQGWRDAEARARGMYDKELGDPQYVIADALPAGSDQDYKALNLKVAVKGAWEGRAGARGATCIASGCCRAGRIAGQACHWHMIGGRHTVVVITCNSSLRVVRMPTCAQA